jgi:glycosyltransferase involved in cell wall biosynthesis
MPKTPLVSVLMPAFNAERHIAEAIESILRQTHCHFELIILDDGSTDRTREVINQFDDIRIIRIYLSENQGLVRARNQLLAAAKGNYIAFLDADDVAFPDRLHLQVQFLEAGKADVCGGEYYSLYEGEGKVKASKQRHSDADIRALIAICSPLCNPAVMGKASIFKQYPYHLGNDYAEDYSLWAELALAGYRFANLHQKIITYRIHSNQTSQVQNLETSQIFNRSRRNYLIGLGMPQDLIPESIPFFQRARLAIPFMLHLNQKIQGISVMANYEIYARFQYRRNGFLTPLIRLERLLTSIFASLRGFFNS